MANEKNNQIEQGIWACHMSKGKWNGIGYWFINREWSGKGNWRGGILSGTWSGKGKWKSLGNGIGTWDGGGDAISNVQFPKNVTIVLAAVIGLISNIISAALGSVVGVIGWTTTIISMIVIVLLSIAVGVMGPSTFRGTWWGNGNWRDEGRYRILDMNGKWKIGPYEGTISGKMKDPKPS